MRLPLALEGQSVSHRRLFQMAMVGLGALYLLQTLSPLRLESDAVDYLSMAAAMADGRALPKASFPPGYPAIIAILDRAGLGSSFTFILLNCFFLGLGVLAVWRIFSEHSIRARMGIVIATLLVISVVKSVAAPLPEAAFFGTSLLSLAAATAALSSDGAKRLTLLPVAFVMAGIALSIRLVGVALVPALLWACLSALHDPRGSARSRRWPATGTVLVVVVLATGVFALSRTSAFSQYIWQPRYWFLYEGLGSYFAGRIYGMLSGFGELLVNLPLSRFHDLRPTFAVTGVLALVALVLARRRASLQPADVYLIFYLAILGFWPYDTPRLWMPVAPLIAAHVVSTLDRLRNARAFRFILPTYAAWFAVTGILALGYTTRISLSGDNFARLYGTDGGMATTMNPTLGQEERERYNARADTILSRYGGRRTSR